MLLSTTSMVDVLINILEGIILILIGWFFVWVGKSIKQWVEGIAAGMTKTVEARTAPIQPGANGGSSLPDAIDLLKTVDGKIDRTHDRIDALHEKVNNVARDFEHLRGRFEQHIESEHEE